MAVVREEEGVDYSVYSGCEVGKGGIEAGERGGNTREFMDGPSHDEREYETNSHAAIKQDLISQNSGEVNS